MGVQCAAVFAVRLFVVIDLTAVSQLQHGQIRIYYDIYHLSLVEIPVRRDMNERLIAGSVPHRLIKPEGILLKACRIYYTEIGVLGAVRSRLADIVKSRPYKLSERKLRLCVHFIRFERGCSPVYNAVSEIGALHIIMNKQRGIKWEMIDSS